MGVLFDNEVYKLAGDFVNNPGGVNMPGPDVCFYRGTSAAAREFQILSGCPSGTTIPMTESCGHW